MAHCETIEEKRVRVDSYRAYRNGWSTLRKHRSVRLRKALQDVWVQVRSQEKVQKNP